MAGKWFNSLDTNSNCHSKTPLIKQKIRISTLYCRLLQVSNFQNVPFLPSYQWIWAKILHHKYSCPEKKQYFFWKNIEQKGLSENYWTCTVAKKNSLSKLLGCKKVFWLQSSDRYDSQISHTRACSNEFQRTFRCNSFFCLFDIQL